MKLNSFHIKNFRNLKDITIDFSEHQNFSLLIGNNGSGKSNILEAIAEIFEISILGKAREIGSFELSYEIADKAYELNSTLKTPEPTLQYPNKIVSIYSGEDQKLWQNCFRDPYLMRYKAIRDNESVFPQFYYFDRSYWEIALLALAISDLPGNKIFLQSVLGIHKFSEIRIRCNSDLRKKWTRSDSGNIILQFYDWLNPDNQEEIIFSVDDLKKSLPGFENDFFANLANCIYIEKENLIQYISIDYQKVANGPILRAKDLSEGEKKLLLLRAVFEFATDEESLVLLDEPDAHVHEARKMETVKLVQEYAEHGRACIMTTHSAKIADEVELSHIVMLDTTEDGTSISIEKDKQEILGKLLVGKWGRIRQNIFLHSGKPLLLVEGMGDEKYISAAIEKLKYPLNIDILHFGGTGAASHFVDELTKCIPNDKIVIVLFDRDEAGAKGLKELTRHGDRSKETTYKKDNFYFLMLPKVPSHQEIDFVIEDFFSFEFKKKILQSKIDETMGYYTRIPKNLRDNFKDSILNNVSTYSTDDMKGFRILLDRLSKLISGDATDIEEI